MFCLEILLQDLHLTHFLPEEHQFAVDLLSQVLDVICDDNDATGNAQNCKMKINLKSNYTSTKGTLVYTDTVTTRSKALCSVEEHL